MAVKDIELVKRDLLEYGWILDSEYIRMNSPSKLKCVKCNSISHLGQLRTYNKYKCKICNPRVYKNNKGMFKDLVDVNTRLSKYNWVIYGEYNGCREPCHVKCLKCGEIRFTQNASYLPHVKCNNCSKPTEKDTERVNARIAKLHLVLVGDYNGLAKQNTVKCLKCGSVFSLKKFNKIREFRCKMCNTLECVLCGKEFNTIGRRGHDRKICYECAPDNHQNPRYNPRYVRLYRQYITDIIYKKFGAACSICGYDKSYAALDFHHVDPSQKEYNPAHVMRSMKLDDVLVELAKCILVCSNCHREIHEKMNQEKYDLKIITNNEGSNYAI